jgi:hypothetical protein
VNAATKKEMRKILKEIQQGKFARQWISENATGRRKYDRLMKKDLNHKIEKVGAALRARMPWLSEELRPEGRVEHDQEHVQEDPPRPDLRHDAARRRAIARLQHDPAREAADGPRARRARGRRHRSGLPAASPGDWEPCTRSRARCTAR